MQRIFRLAATVAIGFCALSAGSVAHAQTIINFDTLTAGTIVSNQYAAQGVTFVAGGLTGTGYTSGQNYAPNTSLDVFLGTVASTYGNGTNALHGVNGWAAETGDPVFTMNLTQSFSSFSATFYAVSAATYGPGTRILAYNGTTLLGSTAATTTGGAVQTLTLNNIASANRIIVTPGTYNDYVSVDNLTFNVTPAAAPEPGSLALIGLGLPLTGAFIARKKRKAS